MMDLVINNVIVIISAIGILISLLRGLLVVKAKCPGLIMAK